MRGTKEEQQVFMEVDQHYQMAKRDLEARYSDWDTKYELFRSHIDESNWPYSSQIFIPQTFTALFEKMARINGGKPRGRLIPREGGDTVSAKILNQLINFQWDEVSRVSNEPMIAKWAKMDLNTRIYGASFAVAKWRFEKGVDGETRFDGPMLKVLNPRDSLPNPSYPTIKNWFQYRDYVTVRELELVNDVSQEEPVYKNLDKLKEAVAQEANASGDSRSTHYTPREKEIRGVEDQLGRDETPDFRTVETVTELRDDRKIVIAPKHGIVLQDMENPYEHKQIPVIQLKYIPVDDDIWGLSEIEPVEKLQKALNALTSQFVDAVNMDLYRVLKVRPTNVQMHTLEWGPGKKWLMNNPDDVVPLEHSAIATGQFVNVYSVLTGAYREAMGETSAAFSNLKPTSSEKTATEIKEGQVTRTVRDNFNKIFLSEAIKKQMMLWLLMDQQFYFSNPATKIVPLRLVGRDVIEEFKNLDLHKTIPETETMEKVAAAADLIQEGVDPSIGQVPLYGVEVDGEVKAKLQVDEQAKDIGTIFITPQDMTGNYDFIVDVEPMQAYSTQQEIEAKREAIGLLSNKTIHQLLVQEGKKPKVSELLIDLFDQSGLHGAEKYFDTMNEQDKVNFLNQEGNNGRTRQEGTESDRAGQPTGQPQAAPGLGNR